MNKVKKKLRHLVRHFNFKKDELSEIEKMYSGDYFDTTNNAYLKLLDESKILCEKYACLCDEELSTKRKTKKLKLPLFSYLKFYFKKLKLLKLLFPIHGFVLYAESKIDAVIGLVDLKGYGFINREVTFTPSALVVVDKSNIFAMNIQIGRDKLQTTRGIAKLEKIHIKKNCWICGGVKIVGNTIIGQNCVVGGGAEVCNTLPENSLAVGRPCKVVKTITKNSKTKVHDRLFELSEKQKNALMHHVKKINSEKFPKEYLKMINGNIFNSMSKDLSYLYSLTRTLCNEYGLKTTTKKRKQEILEILFPNHGENFVVEGSVYIDMLGTILIGNNVTIKNNVKLGGNIFIDDNVTIGENSLLFASGHSILPNERSMKFSFKKGFYEDTKYDFIRIEKNAQIGDNVVISPNSIVTGNIPSKTLYVKGKKLK